MVLAPLLYPGFVVDEQVVLGLAQELAQTNEISAQATCVAGLENLDSLATLHSHDQHEVRMLMMAFFRDPFARRVDLVNLSEVELRFSTLKAEPEARKHHPLGLLVEKDCFEDHTLQQLDHCISNQQDWNVAQLCPS